MTSENPAAEHSQAGEDNMRAVYTERMGELLQTRAQFIPSSVDTENRSVEVTWTTGAPVLRRTLGGSYYEELSLGDAVNMERLNNCLLYTSPSPRDATLSRMPSSA